MVDVWQQGDPRNEARWMYEACLRDDVNFEEFRETICVPPADLRQFERMASTGGVPFSKLEAIIDFRKVVLIEFDKLVAEYRKTHADQAQEHSATPTGMQRFSLTPSNWVHPGMRRAHRANRPH